MHADIAMRVPDDKTTQLADIIDYDDGDPQGDPGVWKISSHFLGKYLPIYQIRLVEK